MILLLVSTLWISPVLFETKHMANIDTKLLVYVDSRLIVYV